LSSKPNHVGRWQINRVHDYVSSRQLVTTLLKVLKLHSVLFATLIADYRTVSIVRVFLDLAEGIKIPSAMSISDLVNGESSIQFEFEIPLVVSWSVVGGAKTRAALVAYPRTAFATTPDTGAEGGPTIVAASPVLAPHSRLTSYVS
jgi:hypothetical protein